MKTVAAAIPGARIQADSTLGHVIKVVIGRSYQGARPVRVQPAATTPTPTGSPTPIKTTNAATNNACTSQ